MKGQNVGYIRVSSVGQNTLRQDQAMASINLDHIFSEKASAKSCDRLARSLLGLQKIINSLVERGVSVFFHKEKLIFSGDETPTAKLMLQVMGAIAEFERSLIKERQREGIQAAKSNGVKFGAPRKITSEQERQIKKKVKAHNEVFTKLTRQILTDRGLEDIAQTYRNPDNNPDLPFLWRSIQWAKPGGIIAMALPGRIFLKQSGPGTRAFNAILQGLEITGILNGSNLSDSEVWPGMSQPFMLFFVRNRVPAANHHFHFVTPHFERRLNDKGRIRIDYQSAQPVAACDVVKDSRLLKTLAVGTSLDVEVVRKLDELEWPSVKSYWESQGLYSGRGYDLSPEQVRQGDARFMIGLPDFIPPANGEFSVDVSLMPNKFKLSKVHAPRRMELYTPPLIIVPESPGSSLITPKSWVIRKPIVFRKSYYGFSAHGSGEADLIIPLLHLVTHSELFRYHVLMTSSRMGAERRTFLKENIENFPFPTIDVLPKRQRQRAVELSRLLEIEPSKPWEAINDFIFSLYGLDEYDRQVMKDTLEVAAPFKEARDRANSFPTKIERNAFYAELQRLLAPSFDITHEKVSIDEVEIATKDIPWHFFTVSSPSTSATLTQAAQKRLVSQITKEANKTGCSRVVVHEKGLLLVGIIGQYRYWTLSRARLCALDILRHHLDAFPMGRK